MLIVAVPLLLEGSSSVVPAGGAIVAVLMTAPMVPATARKMTVRVLAAGSVAVPLKARPAAIAAVVKVPPLAPVAVTKVSVPMLLGSVSVNLAAVTALGPGLTKVSVKLVAPPTTSDGVLAALVADRSTLGPTTTVALPLLF